MPRRLPPAFALVVALLSCTSLAEEPAVRAPVFSATLEGGATYTGETYNQPISTRIEGPTLLLPRVRADGWFLRALGVEGEAWAHVFNLRDAPPPLGSELFAGGLVRGGLAARLLTHGGFLLNGSLGYGAWFNPVIVASFNGTTNSYRSQSLVSHGPVVRLGVGYAGERFEAIANLQGHLPVNERVTQVQGGLWLGARAVDLDRVALWAGINVEVAAAWGAVINAGALRFSAGLKVALLPPRPAAQPLEREAAQGTALELSAVLPDGRPAAGALISLDGATPVAVDARGAWREEVKPGSHEVQAALAGHRAAKVTVQAPEGKVTTFVLRLEALSGPGSLAGVVRAAATGKPVPEASVTVGELQPVQTGADGSYRLERVGPGPVQVRVEAQGFNRADEVVQVPPEAAATLDVQLEPLGKGSPATVRGLVRSRAGEALKASVVIRNSTAKVQVSAEGRFYVTVPGGTYVFVISAPGYVTQTKKVVLADGDQAILHTELQKVAP